MRGGHGGLAWRFQITYAKLQVRQVHQLLLLLHASVHEIKEGTRHYMHMHYTLLGLPLITKSISFTSIIGYKKDDLPPQRLNPSDSALSRSLATY
jgi:hypothetical protein